MAPGKSEHDLPRPVQSGSFSARVTSIAGVWPIAGGEGAAVACRCDRETLAVLGWLERDHAGGRSGAAFLRADRLQAPRRREEVRAVLTRSRVRVIGGDGGDV